MRVEEMLDEVLKNATVPSPWVKGMLEHLNREMPRELGRDRAVDLGAGNLRHSLMLAELFGFKGVAAIDIDPQPLRTHSNVHVVRGDIRQFNPRANSLDLVIFWNCSYELRTPRAIREVLEKIRFGLCRKGLLFANFWSCPPQPTGKDRLTSFPEEKIRATLRGMDLICEPASYPPGHPMNATPDGKLLYVFGAKL